jgi:hypothetical protein
MIESEDGSNKQKYITGITVSSVDIKVSTFAEKSTSRT